jgi:hypothetical protein
MTCDRSVYSAEAKLARLLGKALRKLLRNELLCGSALWFGMVFVLIRIYLSAAS